ncbi:nucleotidyl transferase AbiEii/AbiGii toxin family protein [Gemmatimonadota bacterium]
MERFLYRLSKSPHADKFILKGALMLVTWGTDPRRPTKDIDLLGRVGNDLARIIELVKVVCLQEVEPDGLDFDATSVTGERIAEESEYEGVRVRFRGSMGTARVTMQVDVGFGDVIIPGPVRMEYPVILNLPAPKVLAYTRESVIAEKFHTMVRRGLLNSRMRDYHDVWVLSRHFDFEGRVLSAAIRETFSRRGLSMLGRPVALSEEFSSDAAKRLQWQGYLRKNRLQAVPGDLAAVVGAIADFLGPVAAVLYEGTEFKGRWKAPGPWALQ